MTPKIHLCYSKNTLCRPCKKLAAYNRFEQLLQCLHMFLSCHGMYKQVVNVVYYIVHAIEEFPHCPRQCHTTIHHLKWHSQVTLTHHHKGSIMYICRTDPYLVVPLVKSSFEKYMSSLIPRKESAGEGTGCGSMMVTLFKRLKLAQIRLPPFFFFTTTTGEE